MATKADVASIARQAVAQRKLGDSTWEHNGVDFDLVAGGFCARFVRQCHDAALGQGEWAWPYKAPTAYDMEGLLREAGLQTSNPLPGDIVCINLDKNGNLFRPGHIAIYLGDVDGTVSIGENTSAGDRGKPEDPGTKLTPISYVAGRITGYYAALPVAVASGWEPGDISITLGEKSVPGWLTDHCIVGVKNLGALLGLDVDDHVQDSRTVCLGYKGDVLGAPMPQFPGYTPGPIWIATGNGGCAGWFTDHALVGVAEVAKLLGMVAVYWPDKRECELTA